MRVYPNTKLWHIALREGFITLNSDPLDQLWYLSSELDLDLAIRQMIDAAISCPEIISGFDEKYLPLSSAAALLGKILHIPKLYWRVMYTGNKILRKTFLRFTFRPPDVVALIHRFREEN